MRGSSLITEYSCVQSIITSMLWKILFLLQLQLKGLNVQLNEKRGDINEAHVCLEEAILETRGSDTLLKSSILLSSGNGWLLSTMLYILHYLYLHAIHDILVLQHYEHKDQYSSLIPLFHTKWNFRTRKIWRYWIMRKLIMKRSSFISEHSCVRSYMVPILEVFGTGATTIDRSKCPIG